MAVKDEALSELVFIGILESPCKTFRTYVIRCEMLKAMKPYGW